MQRSGIEGMSLTSLDSIALHRASIWLPRGIYLLNRKGHHHQSKAAKAARLVRKADYSHVKATLTKR